MSNIINTAADPASPMEVLIAGMDGDPAKAIYAMEKRGQAQLVNSDRLPVRIQGGADHMFTELGFAFGDVDASDPLFRVATLPTGWSRQASNHDMWSYLLDQHGRRRVAIFYKAAYYDRSSFMRLEGRGSYLHSVLHGDQVLVLDDDWLPADAARTELESIRDGQLAEAAENDSWVERQPDNAAFWEGRAAASRSEAERTRRLIESLPTAQPPAEE